MMSDRRRQLYEIIEREFVGPDPVDWPGLVQEDGEEILTVDPPCKRYIAGILFPREVVEADTESSDCVLEDFELREDRVDDGAPSSRSERRATLDYLAEAEELINRSNAYRPSALSMTVAIRNGDSVVPEVSAGTYRKVEKTPVKPGWKDYTYPRSQLFWNNGGEPLDLPGEGKDPVRPDVCEGLRLGVVLRRKAADYGIYTVTLENTREKKSAAFEDENCFFQVKLKLHSSMGFVPLPETNRITKDDDYYSNQLLYRNVRNYAVGHGCAAEWDESEGAVSWIASSVLPRFEMKPIVPSQIQGVSLEMLKMSPYGSIDEAISELRAMCNEYEKWIGSLKERLGEIEGDYEGAPERHIARCEYCLKRMRAGIDLLEADEVTRTAFQYMNLAMLMQQLHYNLPLQRWEDDGCGGLRLSDPIPLPRVEMPDTWYDSGNRVYGKWRPFQLAFILMNLHSMRDRAHEERGVVDLIWFPTGGGKTEAYLGLSAYTIFVRRLLDRDDAGTAILMRYTLRLLTAQQYERAASMICSCEIIRREHEDLFGSQQISIGLWVGGSTTPNKMSGKDGAVSAFKKLKTDGTGNPFVIQKCPWCGAQMGPVQRGQVWEVQGYRKEQGARRKEKVVFRCHNDSHGCAFSGKGSDLPLYVVDEAIYEARPTLVLGTVDKFATLPFKPEAQSLFGLVNGERKSSPDLIIQDELHLISGPLGSMVGHYETLIEELCTSTSDSGDATRPKIVASTATISRAKEQCRALYGCREEDVCQFPPPGLDASDSFFAYEDREQNGRQYVGVMALGSPSDSTTAIRLFSSLLYGAKALDVSSEAERDPYWTNMGYFNSLRELGQAAAWIRADIDEHLDTIYKRSRFNERFATPEEYRENRRYIWRDEELTSRISGSEVTSGLASLGVKYPPEKSEEGFIKERPIDICLATNMISVGLDVSRLGLMTVMGQPKTTSEYIQATSRVGRSSKNAPGIVFVVYRPGRPRDRSHYEHFRSYHSRVYCSVEPTSVTPFSSPVRERALHAVMVGMMRLEGDGEFNSNPPYLPEEDSLDRIREIIERRVDAIDPDETQATLARFEHIIQCWEDWRPEVWKPEVNPTDWSYTGEVPLIFSAGSHRHARWGSRGLETPTSMRNVDAACEAEVMSRRYERKED